MRCLRRVLWRRRKSRCEIILRLYGNREQTRDEQRERRSLRINGNKQTVPPRPTYIANAHKHNTQYMPPSLVPLCQTYKSTATSTICFFFVCSSPHFFPQAHTYTQHTINLPQKRISSPALKKTPTIEQQHDQHHSFQDRRGWSRRHDLPQRQNACRKEDREP